MATKVSHYPEELFKNLWNCFSFLSFFFCNRSCSHFSFCNLFSPFIFNLTLESARTFELDSPPPLFSLLQTRLSIYSQINLLKLSHSMGDDWLFQKSELLSLSIQNVHSLALASISRFISCNSRISLQFLQRCLMLSHLLILAHNLPSAWDALPSRGCISTYAPVYLMNRLTIYIWIFKELKSHGKRI